MQKLEWFPWLKGLRSRVALGTCVFQADVEKKVHLFACKSSALHWFSSAYCAVGKGASLSFGQSVKDAPPEQVHRAPPENYGHFGRDEVSCLRCPVTMV